MSDKKQLVKQGSGQIDEDVRVIETEEINYDLDSDTELESNLELIKYEFNMIELPFFTKDKKVADGKARKYIFSEKDNSYMRVIPSGDKELISNKIPQEFDEKVFYGILKLSREQNSKEVVTDYFTLAKVSNVHYNDLGRIKDSLERLRRSVIEINNLFYDAIKRARSDGKEEFNILQYKKEYTFKETFELPEEKREKYRKYFRNSKINEILVLTLADNVYKNIEYKGFLYFNQKELLEINNATARKIFLLITKWQGWEKKSSIKRSCRFLASRIPLSWETKNISSSINTMESACNTLKERNLIDGFILIRTKPVSNSYIEFFFDDKRDKIADYNIKAASTTTGHEGMVIDAVQDEFLDDRQASLFDVAGYDKSEEILSLLPADHRTETVKKVLAQYSQASIEYIRSNIKYTLMNCKDNFPAYLNRSLKEDWGVALREKEEQSKKEKEHERKRGEEEEARKKEKDMAVEKAVNAMSEEELRKYKVKDKYYYRNILEEKVKKGELSEIEAIKDAVKVIYYDRLISDPKGRRDL